MDIRSSTSILIASLGNSYDSTKVFMAEKIILNYINKDISKEDWDDALSVTTAEIVKRMALDTGMKSESDDNHSITYRDIKTVQDFLGASIIAVLDGYKDVPLTSGMTGSYSML